MWHPNFRNAVGISRVDVIFEENYRRDQYFITYPKRVRSTRPTPQSPRGLLSTIRPQWINSKYIIN